MTKCPKCKEEKDKLLLVNLGKVRCTECVKQEDFEKRFL